MHHQLQKLAEIIELSLNEHLPQCKRPSARLLDDAIRYAIFPGGKRIRPLLCVLGARVFQSDVNPALSAACAVEFIHTSSLLFDDLPCMDDAQIRRGIPVVHEQFGEDVAVLAALALLNQSYAIFGQRPALIAEAAACIGVNGMIGGQALDLVQDADSPRSETDESERLSERNRKTSAMMRLSFIAGALACGVRPDTVETLGAVGQMLGEAFQMADDLLDARRSSIHTGKNAGQDRRHNRPSHGALDEEACLKCVQKMVSDARTTLTTAYGEKQTAELMGFVDAMFNKLTAGEQPKPPVAIAAEPEQTTHGVGSSR